MVLKKPDIKEDLRNDRLWLLLFEEEIKRTFSKASIELEHFCSLLPQEDRNKIDLLAKVDDGNELWKKLLRSPNVENLLIRFKEFLKKVNPVLHKHLIQIDELSPSQKQRFFNFVFQISELLDVEAAVKYLASSSKKNRSNLVEIQMLIADKSVDKKRALQSFLRILPFLGNNPVDHVLFTIYENGHHEEVEKFCPNFQQIYGQIKLDEKGPQIITTDSTNIESALNAFAQAEKEWDPSNEPTIAFNTNIELNTCFIKEKPLNLRGYQKELAALAENGSNALICAPTNSGKTRVAIHIARKHFERCAKEKKQFKAIFLVPKRILVEQQRDAFREFFDDQIDIIGISGDSNATKASLSMFKGDSHYILVMTPQIFLNSLREPDRRHNIGFEDISLLFFDEAHYCADDHPCNHIMKIYHDKKDQGTSGELQIVGLTATVGTHGAKSIRQSVEHLALVCANLDTINVVTVNAPENKVEMKEHLNSVPDAICACDVKYPESTQFYCKLTSFKKRCEGELARNLVGREENYELMKKSLGAPIPEGPFTIDAHSSICSLRLKLATSNLFTDDERAAILIIVDKFIILNKVYKYVRLLDGQTALETFRMEMTKLTEGRDSNEYTIEAIKQLELCSDFTSPMLLKLRELLSDQFDKTPESRCLIFSETREICSLLSNCLNRYTNHKSDFLTGSEASERFGLNENQQRTVLEDFNNGKLKVLCATSVADEGLDIKACNLVVKYNNASNEIAHVQRRGRCRHKDSSSILLCDEMLKQREEENRKREQFMTEALNEVHQKYYDFIQMINTMKKNNKEARDKERLDHQQMKVEMANNNAVFAILCVSCSTVLSTTRRLFKANNTNYVIADPNIWTRVQCSPLQEIICKGRSNECRKEMGGILIHKKGGSVLLPNIKLKTLVFVRVHNEFNPEVDSIPTYAQRTILKKWSDCENRRMFSVPPISTYELSEMQRSRGRGSMSEFIDQCPNIFGNQ
ncbi:hypothetical protein M3Y98_00651600 [Aphelenchoides besseyi]|nr:hypothetical protein M3Y98_00651600 [Aphelenchoides besseyi]KAI6208684.1 hypothetical protein M3Y96_00141000 [Aphelenchoides besseyi]